MNIIFLDVDGVLNSINNLIEVYNRTHRPYFGYEYPFDAKCLENLQQLVQATSSKLVITSTWRKDEDGRNTLLKKLKEYDLDKEVIGYTPRFPGEHRGVEIKEYLSEMKQKPNFIILDDDSDMDDLLPFLVLTKTRFGLTAENVQEAIMKLNKNKIREEDEFER